MEIPTFDRIEVFICVVVFLMWVALIATKELVFDKFVDNKRDLDVKRRWYPLMVVLFGMLIACSFTAISVLKRRTWTSLGDFLFYGPMFGLAAYFYIKFTKFCEGCGSAIYTQQYHVSKDICPHCGCRLIGLKNYGGDRSLE